MEFVDTHCHLDLNNFDSDREAVLERASQAGVNHIVIPSLTLASSQSVVSLTGSHPILFAAIGIHPTEATSWNDSAHKELADLALSSTTPSEIPSFPYRNKIVAVGEIGLDYYWKPDTRELQLKVLRQQLDLAAELGLPVILHFREAKNTTSEECAEDLLEILRSWIAELKITQNPLVERPGVLHSFSGSTATAQAAMELGFFIGVTGPVTFTNAKSRQDIIASIPLDRLLIETDAPFLAPHPFRGKRNEPAFVRLIADKIATLQAHSIEEVATITSTNAARLFMWEARA